ncbi:Mitochondrial glycoprotein [Macleaya cordata]|uniref:Mitochondrial glycoprotein n=1 Tax=Macleaya cordata TaxID=56857 RepID=A0A200PPZ5_MACCD|nr:Mitochondrial glycoprotein [Macleaya cordata]
MVWDSSQLSFHSMRALIDRVFRASRRAYLSHSSFSSKTLTSRLQQPLCVQIQKPFSNSLLQTRTYISEMRKSAFEGNILRILRNEIQYESEYAPPKEPVTTFNSFTVEDRPGEQWIRLRSKYGEEDIKIEVTMFDGSVPAPKTGDGDKDGDVQLHISLIVDISKGENCGVLEFVCSAWPDCLDIQKVFMLRRNGVPASPYMGPDFKDLDDELQTSLQEFMEARGVNDELAEFLHEYMMNKDKTEFIRWMGKVKSFVEK